MRLFGGCALHLALCAVILREACSSALKLELPLLPQEDAPAPAQDPLLLGPFSAAPDSSEPAAAPAPGPSGGEQAGAGTEANLLFVQQAPRAELRFPDPNVPTAARLVLSDVYPSTTWFTDKPERKAGSFETGFFASDRRFYMNESWLAAPNAALTGTLEGGAASVLIVTLYEPSYYPATKTLQYFVTVTGRGGNASEPLRLHSGVTQFYQQGPGGVQAMSAQQAVERQEQTVLSLRDVSLFIDDYTGAYGCLSCGYYGRGFGGYGYYGGPLLSTFVPIRRLCPKCWEDKEGGDAASAAPAAPSDTPPDGSGSQCTGCRQARSGIYKCDSCN